MRQLLRDYWLLWAVLCIYISIEISVIGWGIPSLVDGRIFLYHMDEWHQLMAIRAIRDNFTTVVPGSAHSTMFHFLLSGAYIAVLQLAGLISVSDVLSPVTGLPQQNQLFIWLRISTLLFGSGAITFFYLSLRQLKLPLWPTLVFAFSPIWLTLSGYFKYDIALLFWINFSLWLLIKAALEKKTSLYLWAAIPVGLTFATKMSGLPIILVYIVHYFLFFEWKKYLPIFFNGLALSVLVMMTLGIPDISLGITDYSAVIQDVVIDYPQNTANYILGSPYWWYLWSKQLPLTFGYALAVMFLVGLYLITRKIWAIGWQDNIQWRILLWLMIGLISFAASLTPLRLFAAGNRSLVLLPFIVLLLALGWQDWKFKVMSNLRKGILITLLSLQILQSLSWMSAKWSVDLRATSSQWIMENIDPGTTIGSVGHPIYARGPDIILKDFFDQERLGVTGRYQYTVIEELPAVFPEYVIVVSQEESHNQQTALKKDVLLALEQADYQEVAEFSQQSNLVLLFASELDFLIPNLVPTPTSISIYALDHG